MELDRQPAARTDASRHAPPLASPAQAPPGRLPFTDDASVFRPTFGGAMVAQKDSPAFAEGARQGHDGLSGLLVEAV